MKVLFWKVEKLIRMNGNYILDANIVIDIFRGHKKTIEQVSKMLNVYVPVIVLGELYYGANKSNKTQQRILEIRALEYKVNILRVNKKTANIYGKIKDQLRQKGKPIPENDIWIAAISKETGFTLVTRDKHFTNVAGLTIIDLG